MQVILRDVTLQAVAASGSEKVNVWSKVIILLAKLGLNRIFSGDVGTGVLASIAIGVARQFTAVNVNVAVTGLAAVVSVTVDSQTFNVTTIGPFG